MMMMIMIMMILFFSFHVGSNNHNPAAYVKAIEQARQVYDRAVMMGFVINVLDIGGGFPGKEQNVFTEVNTFDQICVIIEKLGDKFRLDSRL